MFQGFITLLLKIQGRDKLTKMLIYSLKLIDSIKSLMRGRATFRFERMAFPFQRARQIMRLGKFIAEYGTILKLIRENKKDQFGRLVRILCHCIFSFYWVADNVSLLCAFQFVKVPEYQMYQTAMTVKFVGLCFAAFLNLRSWFRLHHAEIKARRELEYLTGAENLRKNQELIQLIKEQWLMFLLCLKIYADMLPSIAKSVIAKQIFKIDIPRIVQALGGLINAFVACIITFL